MSVRIEFVPFYHHPSGREYLDSWGLYENDKLVLIEKDLEYLTKITGVCVFPEELALAQYEEATDRVLRGL